MTFKFCWPLLSSRSAMVNKEVTALSDEEDVVVPQSSTATKTTAAKGKAKPKPKPKPDKTTMPAPEGEKPKPKPPSKTKPSKTMPAPEDEGQKESEVVAEEEMPILKKPAAKLNPKAKAGLKRPAAAPKAAPKEPETRKATKYCYHSDGKWGVKLNGKEQCTVGGMKKVVVLRFLFCLLMKKVAIKFSFLLFSDLTNSAVVPATGQT